MLLLVGSLRAEPAGRASAPGAQAAPAPPDAIARSIADGVYAPEQAVKGRTLFRDVCIVCHPDPFWRTTWEGRSLNDLYTKIVKFMPDDAPGTLSVDEALSAVAYILEANGFRPGDRALPAEPQVLDTIRIVSPAP